MILYILDIGEKFFLFGLVALLFKIAVFRGGALRLGGAEEARKVHTLEVAGSNPALATSRRHSGRTHFYSPIDSTKASVSRGFCAELLRLLIWRVA